MESCCESRLKSLPLMPPGYPRLPLYDPTNKDTAAVIKRMRNDGVEVQRLCSRYKLHKRCVTLLGKDGRGLKYTPSRKSEGSTMLFADLVEVSKVNIFTKTYRKANLDPKEYQIVSLRNSEGVEWLFAFRSNEFCETWLNAIGYLIEQGPCQGLSPFDKRIRSLWDRADLNHDGELSKKEVRKLLLRINASSDKEMQMHNIFKKFDASGDNAIDMEEFRRLYISLFHRPEVQDLFLSYAKSDSKKGMTLGEFTEFLRAQGDDVKQAETQFIGLGLTPKEHMSLSHFAAYLFDFDGNSVVDTEQQRKVDDMDQPMACYFINSSHNTYLSGNQLSSSSSVDMYKKALLAGCRCVELDCWNGNNNDPVVYHGHTYTSKIRFEDIIEVINENAFVESDLPVILSLEVHTSPEQSRVMAGHLQRIFGSQLLMSRDLNDVKYTPNGMSKRILVKWKMNAEDSDDMELDASGNVPPPSSPCPELSSCVTVGAFKTKDYGKDAKPFNVQSLDESKVCELARSTREDFTLQNTRMMTRVYPKGTRFLSSNYNPMPSWFTGCQIVALNYQSWDDHMRVNDGMFMQSNRFGYVLKPKFLTDPSGSAKPTRYSLTVKIISGSQLPRPSLEKKGDTLDPYVKLRIVSLPEQNSVSTRSIKNNGLNPVWNETFELQGLCAEIDILSIRVSDSNDVERNEESCECCIPIKLIRNGYRALPMKLCTDGLLLQSATVLCHFELKLQ